MTSSPMFGTDTWNFCSQVQKGGPADKAGLEDEDIIIEVNGENVQAEPYERVVDRIKGSSEHVTLLVCGKKAYDYFRAKKIPIVSSMVDPLVASPGGEGETAAAAAAAVAAAAAAEFQPDSHTAKARVSGDLLHWDTVPKSNTG